MLPTDQRPKVPTARVEYRRLCPRRHRCRRMPGQFAELGGSCAGQEPGQCLPVKFHYAKTGTVCNQHAFQGIQCDGGVEC